MKAVCIIGSPKNKGNTAYVVDKVIEGMKDSEIEVSRYVLGEMDINFCEGCNYCNETRKCKQTDDMDIIIEDIFESDIVLIASPSYWGDVTGQLKTFIDRSLPYCDTLKGGNIVPKGKFRISVAIRAGQRKKENMDIIDTIEHYFGHLHIKPIKRFMMERINYFSDFKGREEELKQAYNLGKNIIETIKGL